MDREALEALRYFSDPNHPNSFVSLAGSGHVLLSAPHAVWQTREGKPKYAERYTGMLCMLLHRKLGVPCIYKTRNLNDDANYDPQSPYRDEVCRILCQNDIRIVLDLHQLSPSRSMALCIGTGRGAHLGGIDAVTPVRKAFERRSFAPITLDDPFSASAPVTVSATAARMGACALQLELNTALLMEDTPTERFADVLDALSEAVQSLNGLCTQTQQRK